jgi:hypothetical protein
VVIAQRIGRLRRDQPPVAEHKVAAAAVAPVRIILLEGAIRR